MTPSPLRRPRGVTLVELMVALAVSAIVLAALFGVVQGQQSAFFQGHLQRAAQGSARAALAYVEQRLAMAGYGMDAPLAFDFQYYTAGPCPALAGTCTAADRDAADRNDELVFHARNPRYWLPVDRTGNPEPRGNAWRVISLDGGSIALSARAGDTFEKGRILQVVCVGGDKYAYMTVARTVGPLLADNANQPITLEPSVTANPFRRQDAAAAEGCFTGGAARAFLIDRFRFHVRPVATGSAALPYLVLDAGLDLDNNGVTEAEEIVVAEGIESFQVGYVMTNDALAPRGTEAGTRITFATGAAATTGSGLTLLQFPGVPLPGDWLYRPTSWFRYAVGPSPTIANERLTDHQANIRAVRIAIVARGAEPDPAGRRNDVLLPILNQNALPSWIAAGVPYNRTRVETTVPVRNMVARGLNDF